MKKVLSVFILMTLVVELYGQEKANYNITILVNDEIWLTSTVINFKVPKRDEYIQANYTTGNLEFNSSDFELLKSISDSLTIYFDHYSYVNNKQILNNFELPFFNNWMDMSYLVLRVYDINRKEYKGVFDPLDSRRNYTYELNYPGGSMLRVRNKVKKKKCH